MHSNYPWHVKSSLFKDLTYVMIFKCTCARPMKKDSSKALISTFFFSFMCWLLFTMHTTLLQMQKTMQHDKSVSSLQLTHQIKLQFRSKEIRQLSIIPLNYMQLLKQNCIVCYISTYMSAGELFRRDGCAIIFLPWRWQPSCGSWLIKHSPG